MVLKGAAKMNIGFYVKSGNADGVNAKDIHLLKRCD